MVPCPVDGECPGGAGTVVVTEDDAAASELVATAVDKGRVANTITPMRAMDGQLLINRVAIVIQTKKANQPTNLSLCVSIDSRTPPPPPRRKPKIRKPKAPMTTKWVRTPDDQVVPSYYNHYKLPMLLLLLQPRYTYAKKLSEQPSQLH
jgi:hypothetical protein